MISREREKRLFKMRYTSEEIEELFSEPKESFKLTKTNGWIRCIDEMPKSDKRVLVTTSKGYLYIAKVFNSCQGLKWRIKELNNALFPLTAVVAWQELPQVYKEENL